jgi:hypothetical protein
MDVVLFCEPVSLVDTTAIDQRLPRLRSGDAP